MLLVEVGGRGLPGLGLLYLAAALEHEGIPGALRVLPPDGTGDLVDLVRALKPGLLGLSLHTENALATYDLVARLRASGLEPPVLVAGGPHAAAVPHEPIAHGFDAVVTGEGELVMVRAATHLDLLAGGILPQEPIRDLDSLPSPTLGLTWLPEPIPLGTPAPMLSSRGCPGRCAFCASKVVGKRYRFHGVARVIADMEDWHRASGATAFSFHDDAFTASGRRLTRLCDAMSEALSFRPSWWCESRVDHLDQVKADAMARAGCHTVVLGVESGSQRVLRLMGKGTTPERAEAALVAAKQAGLRTQVNIMLGFPGETAEDLDQTLAFMERVSPMVDFFSPMGITIPYPGTEIYSRHHEPMGFTGWWLDRSRVGPMIEAQQAVAAASPDTPGELVGLYETLERAVLEAGFFSYSREVERAIDRCLSFRREHTLARLGGGPGTRG